MKYLYISILVLFILPTCNSQTFNSGFYSIGSRGSFFFLNGDSSILFLCSPVRGYSVFKAKFETNHQLRFVPVPNKFENVNEVLSVLNDSSSSKVRFKTYGYWYDSEKDEDKVSLTQHYKDEDSLVCYLEYCLKNNNGCKKQIPCYSYFRNDAYEFVMPNIDFETANLVVPHEFEKYAVIPIVKNKIVNYRVRVVPVLWYDVRIKNTRYRYHKKEDTFEIHFNEKWIKGWYKFSKHNDYQVYPESMRRAVQRHIDELKGK